MANEPVISTAEHTLHLIELFLAHPEGWTPQELLLELDLPRSSLFVLLRTLKTLRYIDQAGRRGRYLPGPRLLAWRAPHSPSNQDLLAAFYQETEAGGPPRETLALALPGRSGGGKPPADSGQSDDAAGHGGGWVIAAQVESGQQVRSTFVTGHVYSNLPAAAQVLDPTPPAEIIANGYSLVAGADTNDLALPVCRDGRTPEAALLLSAPAFRWTPERLVEAFLAEMRDTAAHLSYRLGAPYYTPYQSRMREGLQSTVALNADEITAFLRGPYAASLACVRPDGRPHVIPVWQEWDGQVFYVIAWNGSQWADHILMNPKVSLTVDEPWSPLRRVVVQGSAKPLEVNQSGLERLLQRMTHRYLGQPAAPVLIQQVQRAFLIRPDSLRGWRGLL